MRRRGRAAVPGRAAVVLAAGAMLLSACATGAYQPTTATVRPAAAATTYPPNPDGANPKPGPTGSQVTSANCLQSYAPDGPLPNPGEMPSGSYMAGVKARGYLIAGVSADTLLLGSRNPVTGTIEGFDIDMLRAVATAIFGTPDKIQLRVITAAQRLPLLENGSVDIVARNMTITCARWKDIAFSTEYYRAGQKVLVQLGSPARSMADLKGKKVCAPTGSTSMDTLRTFPGLVPVGADTHTGCLALFQEGQVDAITGDDTVLAGLAAQDPYAHVVQGKAFTAEPYGLGVAKTHPDFVRFVNAVLARMRADGQWTRAYARWLAPSLGPAPAPPVAVYGRQP